MAIFENLSTLSGAPLEDAALQGRAVLVVNVASRCGLTPQYTGLEQLQERYGERGFTVLGVPCNQFGEQEPGSAEEIQTFCSTTYGVTEKGAHSRAFVPSRRGDSNPGPLHYE